MIWYPLPVWLLTMMQLRVVDDEDALRDKCLPNLILSLGDENGNSGTVSGSEETTLTSASCLQALSTSSSTPG